MTTHIQASEARRLLSELLILLQQQQEGNWSRGIKAAISELTDSNGQPTSSNFENARSIYRTMTAGGRGFSEYFIWVADEDQRLHINQTMDMLRTKLWEIFEDGLESRG